MPAVVVDPEGYSAASAHVGVEVAQGLSTAYTTLTHGLIGTYAMAGSDLGGTAWGAQYDPTAQQAASAICAAQRAALNLAVMLERTGLNHGLAETYSNAGHVMRSTTDTHDYAADTKLWHSTCLVPSGAGGTGDLPTGWKLLKDLVGLIWPDGSPSRLRTAATAWHTAGTSIGALTSSIDSAVLGIEAQQSPEVDNALGTCQLLKRQLIAAASACHQVGHHCNAHAHLLDELHASVKTMLVELIAMSAATQAVGLFGALFTFGASEVAAQEAEAVEATSYAARIALLIKDFVTAAKTAATSLLRAEQEAADVEETVTPLANAGTVTADVTEVEAAESTATTAAERAELAAEQRLASAAKTGRVDLRAEERAGGHTLDRHVGKTDAELAARGKKVASTFTDEPAAELATSENIATHESAIDKWLESGQQRLVINGSMASDGGRCVTSAGEVLAPTGVRTVLQRTSSGFLVLSSFPTP